MSGTSLDGLDLALCEFERTDESWNSKILDAKTISYSQEWKEKLWNVFHLSGYELTKLDIDFGKYIGKQVREMINGSKSKIDLISSHGHTIFHQPEEGITYQIGSGSAIAATTRISTACNFRVLDVALKGQGAPLVPFGDIHLFSEYDYCLNLGGFANVSYSWHKKRIAYDICPVNFILNHLATKDGHEFDEDGKLGRKGNVNDKLLKELNQLAYYHKPAPKSLGREWVEQNMIPLLERINCNNFDKIRTLYEHISFQLSRLFTGSAQKKVLVTGGGAHNKFLMELIRKKVNHKVIIPNKLLIDYKEAYVFAFLGVLRMRRENNCLSSVTGAAHDSIGGTIYLI